MKKILFILPILMCSCAAPKFIVTGSTPADDYGNCNITMTPINKRAVKLQKDSIDSAFIPCGEYKQGDVIKITRKFFTNY